MCNEFMYLGILLNYNVLFLTFNTLFKKDKCNVSISTPLWKPHTSHPFEICNEFMYLGILLNYNGVFTNTQKMLSNQGKKAVFSCI
jgi:hypothetical protein